MSTIIKLQIFSDCKIIQSR